MKNILKTLFVIILSILCFSFTTNNGKEKSATSIQDLSSDARFISLAEDQMKAMDNVTNFDAFESFIKKDNLTNSDINQIASLLGYPNRAAYDTYISNKNAIIEALDEDYNLSQYTQAQLTQLSLDVLNNSRSQFRSKSTNKIETPIDPEPTGETNECEDLCEEVRKACILEVGAAAVAAHIGCGIADITVLAGIACHSGVLIAQGFGNRKCNKEYDKCIYDCRH
ncbi:hypothetical protein [uncultured Dokdonia sp.]|uniref:hypothetical protein n=1 Tax=uncultured Dokdonia sp. TaxID=575653 RepID=UPI00260E2490|nr:hypothetical protein [uncultured Dokdonia sp.]